MQIKCNTESSHRSFLHYILVCIKVIPAFKTHITVLKGLVAKGRFDCTPSYHSLAVTSTVIMT